MNRVIRIDPERCDLEGLRIREKKLKQEEESMRIERLQTMQIMYNANKLISEYNIKFRQLEDREAVLKKREKILDAPKITKRKKLKRKCKNGL